MAKHDGRIPVGDKTFSQRQIDILDLLCAHHDWENPDLAKVLFCSEKTIKNNLADIYNALDLPKEGRRRLKRHQAREWYEKHRTTTTLDSADDGDISFEPVHREPRQLPPAPRRFVNRVEELARLDQVFTMVEDARGPKVMLLTGMHGVGKSVLGAHWAAGRRAEFADGELFIDFAARRSGIAVDLAEILGDLLRDLGLADSAIPQTFDARQKMFRTLTASKRLLLFLDDVNVPAQVTTLLPSGAGSLVVATSSYLLEELIFDGADHIPIDIFDEAASYALLASTVGLERLDAEPKAVKDLTTFCEGLPIALSVCAGRLAIDHDRTVGWVLDGIAHASHPLRAVSGTGKYALDAVCDFAYQDLDETARLAYRRIGLHPGNDLTAASAAILADLSVAETTTALDRLTQTHLLERRGDARVRMHGLLRHHARGWSEVEDAADTRDRVVARLVDWYCAALRQADVAVVADRLRLSPDEQIPAEHVPHFESPATAMAWFDIERANIAAVAREAAARELDRRVWQIAEALWPFCYNQKLYSLWTETYEAGVIAACRQGDLAAEARMRASLAWAYAEQDQIDRAAAEIRDAQIAAADCGNLMLEGSVAEFAGVIELNRGEAKSAFALFRDARAKFAECHSVRGVAIQDYQIGKVRSLLGEPESALDAFDLALTAFRSINDGLLTGRALRRKGELLRGLAQLDEASAALTEALELAVSLDSRFDQAQALEALAGVAEERLQGEVTRAIRQQAYRVYKQMGHPKANEIYPQLNDTSS